MQSARARSLYVEHSWRNGIRSILAPRQAQLPPNISSFFGKESIPLESGRSALALALKLSPLQKGARVGVQAYTCTGVFDAIVAAGHTPVFLDIEPEHYTVSAESIAKHRGGIDALVAVHTFGHPYSVDDVHSACGDIPVIEDCAHAMTAEFKGRRVGSFGDAAIYSFRPGKLLSAGGGGMLVLRDYGMPTVSGIDAMAKHWSRGAIFLHYVQAMAGGWLKKSISALDSPGGVSGRRSIRRMTPGDILLLEDRLPSLPSIVAAHRRNASLLLDALNGGPFQLPRVSPDIRHDYYLFALRFDSEEKRKRAQVALNKLGVGAFQLYHIALQKARDFGYRGDCPNSEIAAKTVLILPVHPGVSEAAIRIMGHRLSESRDGSR